MLGTVSSILDKAAAHAQARKIDETVLLGTRLFPDMYPLSKQVQIMSDMSKNGIARLAGVEAPKYEDTEKTFAELKARLAKTVDFIKSVKPEQINGADQRDVSWTFGGNTRTMTGLNYVSHYMFPHFYFHCAMVHGILRHCGVDIGKRDFLGAPVYDKK